eukprot:TRINITY_DN30707_c0_g1_i1.p1 TRINITY_DN30707_c0_g1~~TRINITY_DN30707_c0_g1_i1.p1  ORF type:complete len:222 (-),score=47.21 TRINITY_DN30707_c0_g1_i1:94-684(-)
MPPVLKVVKLAGSGDTSTQLVVPEQRRKRMRAEVDRDVFEEYFGRKTDFESMEESSEQLLGMFATTVENALGSSCETELPEEDVATVKTSGSVSKDVAAATETPERQDVAPVNNSRCKKAAALKNRPPPKKFPKAEQPKWTDKRRKALNVEHSKLYKPSLKQFLEEGVKQVDAKARASKIASERVQRLRDLFSKES